MLYFDVTWRVRSLSRVSKAGFGPQLFDLTTAAMEAFEHAPPDEAEVPPWKKWHDADWVKPMLQDKGFINVDVSSVIHTASLDNADQVVRLATESSPMLHTSNIPHEKLGNARQKFKQALGLRYDSAFKFITAANIYQASLKLDP